MPPAGPSYRIARPEVRCGRAGGALSGVGASSLNGLSRPWFPAPPARHHRFSSSDPRPRLALQVLPLEMLWLLFPFTYIFMPKTKVRITSGLIGGALTAALYQTVQTLYIQAPWMPKQPDS